MLHSICQQIWKLHSGHRTGKGQFSLQSQRKAMPKNVQTIAQLHSSHMLALLPGKSHGQRSLVGCSPWGREELDMTERLPFHFSLSCFGEGDGNPLQCSCLENPRDREAWWAAVYGITQSQTQLKWLSSLAVAEILKNNNSHRKLFLMTDDSISSSGIFCKTLVEVYFFFCLGPWRPKHCQ